MRYAYTFPALFAAVAIAAPIIGENNDATVETVKRDEDLLGDGSNGYNSYSDHLATVGSLGILKRDDEDPIEEDDYLDVDNLGIFERGEENVIDEGGYLQAEDLGILKRDEENVIDEGGYLQAEDLGILKRDDEDIIDLDDYNQDDVLGIIDTGILKRDEDLLKGDVLGFANVIPRSEDDSVGTGSILFLGDGLLREGEVENAKRDGGKDATESAIADASSKLEKASNNLADTLTKVQDASKISRREEGLRIDDNNILTGANVLDDADIGTPVVGVDNPVSL